VNPGIQEDHGEEILSMAENVADLETPFWAFSLAVYAADGVAEECLALQERLNLDVNLLLFAAYTGAVEGVRLAPPDVAAANVAVSDWHNEIVRPIRRARQALKAPSTDVDNPLQASNATLRLQVKRAELESEKIEQAMLWQWSRQALAGRSRNDGALAANIKSVLEFYGGADAPCPHLLKAAAGYAARRT
jgi:uncharacterized protein (TIGR02444 family)